MGTFLKSIFDDYKNLKFFGIYTACSKVTKDREFES